MISVTTGATRPADHVRDRRRGRPARGGARAPRRATAARAPVRSATAPRSSASSTRYGELCDSIWLHRTRTRTPISRAPLGDRQVARRPRGGASGASRTWASGRCAASRATSCTRRSGAGSRSTARSRSPARTGSPTRRSSRWRRERDAIKADVLAHGWDEELGAFTQSYGSRSLDASNLLLAQVGFVAPRRSAVRLDRARHQEDLAPRLLRRPLPRQQTDDGLAGGEGTFTICTLWLVLALTQIGARRRRPRSSSTAGAGLRQRPRPAVGGALARGRAARQLSAGLHPHRDHRLRLRAGEGAPARIKSASPAPGRTGPPSDLSR